jgi:hypothetical protein
MSYCRRDEGVPDGWSFNGESMATREMAGLETRWVESLLVVHLCLSLLCLVDAKRQFLCP